MLLNKGLTIHQVSSWLVLALALSPCVPSQAAIIAAMPGVHSTQATTSVSASQQKFARRLPVTVSLLQCFTGRPVCRTKYATDLAGS